MHSFKKKIRILEKLLNKLVKYSKSFDKVKCKIVGLNIIIEQELKNKDFDVVIIKVPVSDIDSYIIKERARLLVHTNYNNESRNIDKAIIEDDVMNLQDKVKKITG